MALVDRNGNAVRSGNGSAIGTRHNSGGGGGGGNAVRSRNRTGGGGGHPSAGVTSSGAAAAIAAQKEHEKLNLNARNQYQEMAERPTVAGNPNVAGNTYANAPALFTEGRSGTSYYPAHAPDTMFRGIMGKLTGGEMVGDVVGKLSSAAGGPETFMGGLLDAYKQFDPVGDFAQQTMYGMNEKAKQEYSRQEASNPDWKLMSEADRVSLARKPQMDNQLPNAYIGGPNGTQNEAQLDALRPAHMPQSQWDKLPRALKMPLATHQGGGVAPVQVPVEEEEAQEEAQGDVYSFFETRPDFNFAGLSGLSTFAEGGVVEARGVGGLFEDMHRPAPMDPVLEHHYKNIAQGKAVQNEDGSVSTVYTAQVDIDGVPTLIPTVWDGQILSEEAATQRALESGKAWPTAATHPELRQYDIKLHEQMQPMPAEAAKMMLMQR